MIGTGNHCGTITSLQSAAFSRSLTPRPSEQHQRTSYIIFITGKVPSSARELKTICSAVRHDWVSYKTTTTMAPTR